MQTLHASPDDPTFQLRANLQVLEQSLDDQATGTLFPAALIAQAGLQKYIELDTTTGFLPPAMPAEMSAKPINAQPMDVRLGLTMLTQSFGAKENKAVLDAQGEPGRQVLTLLGGSATLADIRQLLQSTGLQFAQGQETLTLDVPLVIWSGAELHLLPGDTLLLNRASGAFVLNFGHVTVDRATIASTGDENPHNTQFRPFITTSGGGSIQLDQARILGLGFGHTSKFSGFSVVRNALLTPAFPTRISDSLFVDIIGIATSGTSDVVIQGNVFRDMRGSAIAMTQSRHARVLSNLFSGALPTNAIRIERGSIDAIVAGNVILGGTRAGIVVRHDSHQSQIMRNIVWRRDGGGITLAGSKCSRVVMNLVMDNGQKGIEVRNSQDSVVEANWIRSNHSAGVWISAQPADARTFLNHNVLSENGSGIASATGGDIILQGNDFTAQFPQFLSGDLARQSRHIAQNIFDPEPFLMTATGIERNLDLSPDCPQNQAGP